MDKLIENARRELKQISEKGFSKENLEMTCRLLDIVKDASEIKEMEEEMLEESEKEHEYEHYDKGHWKKEKDAHHGHSARMKNHIDRICEYIEMYEYGKEHYHRSGDDDKMHDGLEKLMYSICMLIESMMDYSDSPEEKEIIHRHIRKLGNI